jgi:transcriptional regulator with XRE-family HTH domain
MDEARAAAAWVKTQRLAAGMTQEELAGRSGLSVRAISNLERGRTTRPHPRSLEVLAAALGLPAAEGAEWSARLRAVQSRSASAQAAPALPSPALDSALSAADLAPPARAIRRHAARRVQIALAALLLIAASATVAALTASKSPGHTAARPAPPPTTLGIWTGADRDGGYVPIAGQRPNVANTYLYWGGRFPTAFAAQARSAGATPFVEIEPWQGAAPGHPGDCGYSSNFPAMTTIGSNGPAISRYLRAFGSAIAAFGHPVILTFAHEFNVSGQYPWAQGDCERTSPAQWIKAWDTVRSDIDATAGSLAYFMWAPGADTGGTSIDPSRYWPGASQVDMVGVEGYPDTRWGSQLGTFAGLFGTVFDEIHTLTRLPIFIAETDLSALDGAGYQSLPGFIAELCASGGDGVLEFQQTRTLSAAQWNELDQALATRCG